MTDRLASRPPGRVRRRPSEKRRSGNPAGRRIGCRNKTTLAAAALLAGEAEALTRKAVELALVGDPTALRLCIERILPQCRERSPCRRSRDRECGRHRCRDEGGHLRTCRRRDHAGRCGDIAALVDTFVQAIETSDFERRLQLVETGCSNDSDAAAGMHGARSGERFNP